MNYNISSGLYVSTLHEDLSSQGRHGGNQKSDIGTIGILLFDKRASNISTLRLDSIQAQG